MESENTSLEAAKTRPLATRPAKDGIQYFYANNIAIGSSNFDVRLIFGEIVEATEENIIVEQRAQVSMGWLEAKILAEIMQANIKDYERRNGILTIPELPSKVVIPDLKYLNKAKA
jgi:hypothetical protein